MDTPQLDHLTAADYEHVYEPAEDSFLLLDALEADIPYLEKLQPQVCVEIGSGSGVIITALAKRFKNSALCLGTDINPHACKVSKRTARHNAAAVDCLNCNLADGLKPHAIDLLVFNPPYVVTTDEELRERRFETAAADSKTEGSLVFSWAGGVCGRRVIDELLPKLDAMLSPFGVLYLLLLRENNPEEVVQQLEALSFRAAKFMQRHIPGEHLYILKVTRRDNDHN